MKWLSLLLLVGIAYGKHCRKIDIDKSSGFCTVPDSTLTPGEMDPSLACVSNTERPRSVTDSRKTQSSVLTDIQQIRRNPQASLITGPLIGWAGRTERTTFGSSRTQASLDRALKMSGTPALAKGVRG